MEALAYILEKFGLDSTKPSPIEIPNKGREMLGPLFKELDYRVGAEIGVEKGIFSSVLLKAHPKLELFCVDAWTRYRTYKATLNEDDLPAKFFEAQERLKGYNVHFRKQFSMDAVKHFKDESLDFVYIDANHDLPWVMDDIVQWSKKVRPGGIVAGHDYINASWNKSSAVRVREAVWWYTELKPIKTWFLIGTQARVPGEVRDTDRSFFWVVP